MKLQIVGGGKMGQALLGGLCDRFAPASELGVVEPDRSTRDAVSDAFPKVAVSDVPSHGVPTVLAVKPHLAVDVAAALPPIPQLLSVCAGVTTSQLEAVTSAAVVRCMPNTPALVRYGASAVAVGASGTESDLQWGLEILRSVGVAEAVTEHQIDAVTGLSGSGPAYVFLIAEAMTDAGVAAGLQRSTAQRLAYQTIAGAGQMLLLEGADAAQLRANVTTPAGTTAAGLGVLESRGIRAAFSGAVAAATERSRELGSS
ncbi:MAG: pyrroline-5-carboxylate reductase [Acidimicrobiia bacterium]|nr:pyrroline-5-carboxylate reductase [Acidimicrobiia bacterium]